MSNQVLEGLTVDQFNTAVPVKLQALYNEAAGAYVLKAADLRSWAIVMLKYPTIVNDETYKVRVSLAIKDGDNWTNIETGLTKAEVLLESGFLSQSEAETALEWIEENATEDGNKHARLRMLPTGSNAYMAFSTRVNRKPGEAGALGDLAKNCVAIKQLMLSGFTLERESAVVASFEGLNLPVPAKITLTKKIVYNAVAVEAVSDEEEVYEVKASEKRKAVAGTINF